MSDKPTKKHLTVYPDAHARVEQYIKDMSKAKGGRPVTQHDVIWEALNALDEKVKL